jgi:hypothetical protein
VLATLLGLVIFGLVRAGEQRRDRRLVAAAGIVAGLSLYTYASARVFCLIPPVYLILRFVGARRRGNDGPPRPATLLAIYLGTMILVLLPHALTLVATGKLDALWVRGAEVSLLNWIRSSHSLEPLWNNILDYAGMLFFQGPLEGRMNTLRLPMLSVPAGACFLIGLYFTLANLRRKQDGGTELLVALWIAAGVLLGIFTLDPYSPNVYRIGFIIPIVYLVVGVGLTGIVEWLRTKTKRTWVRHLPWLVIASVAAHDLVLYFVVAPRQRETHWVFCGPQVALARALTPRLRAGEERVVLDDLLTDRLFSLYRVANNLLNHDLLAVERGDDVSLPTFDLLHDRPEQIAGALRSGRGEASICLVTIPGQEELVEQILSVRGIERIERPHHGWVASLFTIDAKNILPKRRARVIGSGSEVVARGAIHVPRDVVARLVLESEADWEIRLDDGLVFTPGLEECIPIARGLHPVTVRIGSPPAVVRRLRPALVVADEKGPVHRTHLEDLYPVARLTGGLTLRWTTGQQDRERRIISFFEIPAPVLRGGFTLEGEIVLPWLWPGSVRIEGAGPSAFLLDDVAVSIRPSGHDASTGGPVPFPPGRSRVKVIALPCADRTAFGLGWDYFSPGRMNPMRFDYFRVADEPE